LVILKLYFIPGVCEGNERTSHGRKGLCRWLETLLAVLSVAVIDVLLKAVRFGFRIP
jgi:hypothetical protein